MTLKLAETADGFASGDAHDGRLRITGPIADLRVQVMRSTHEAIMVGVGTALADDPALTVRLPARRPQAVARRARPPPASARALAPRGDRARCSDPRHRRARRARTRRLGASPISASQVERVGVDAEGGIDLRQALRALAARGITRVFSEGGPRVAGRLIALKLADTVALITAEKPLGRPGVPALSEEARATLLDGSRYRPHETLAYGPDTMRVWERTE